MNKVINSEDLTRIIEDYVNREPLDDFEAGYNQALTDVITLMFPRIPSARTDADWEFHELGDYVVCRNCGAVESAVMSYCPVCGAHMKGVIRK